MRTFECVCDEEEEKEVDTLIVMVTVMLCSGQVPRNFVIEYIGYRQMIASLLGMCMNPSVSSWDERETGRERYCVFMRVCVSGRRD